MNSNDFVILDKQEGGSVLVDMNKILIYYIGRKTDKICIDHIEDYSKSTSYFVTKNPYIIENYLNKYPFIKLAIKDVDVIIYVNINYIDFIDNSVKQKGENFTSIDNLIYLKDGNILNVVEPLLKIKEKIQKIKEEA